MKTAIAHLAGPLLDGVQTCERCGMTICDYRNAATPRPGAQRVLGFAPGTVTEFRDKDGNSGAWATGWHDDALACSQAAPAVC